MFVNNNKDTPVIHYKGEILLHNYNRMPVLDMTFKLCPSTNHITAMFTTELHIFKQQCTPTAIKMYFARFSS